MGWFYILQHLLFNWIGNWRNDVDILNPVL